MSFLLTAIKLIAGWRHCCTEADIWWGHQAAWSCLHCCKVWRHPGHGLPLHCRRRGSSSLWHDDEPKESGEERLLFLPEQVWVVVKSNLFLKCVICMCASMLLKYTVHFMVNNQFSMWLKGFNESGVFKWAEDRRTVSVMVYQRLKSFPHKCDLIRQRMITWLQFHHASCITGLTREKLITVMKLLD